MFNWTHAINNFMIIIWICLFLIIPDGEMEMISYLSVVRPSIEYADTAYMTNASVSTKRYNRTDPHHYITLEFTSVVKFDTHCDHSFSFYEMISASNKQLIMELQYDLCDWAATDSFLGAVAREAFFKIPKTERPGAEFKCPFMPGRYSFKNMKLPLHRMPMSLPFQNGRAYYTISCRNKVVGKARADFQILAKNEEKPAKLEKYKL